MRAARVIVWVLPALLGCNALTGVSDLEPVACSDCDDSAVVDSSPPDTARRDSALDTALGSGDTATDTTSGCRTDDECDDDNPCTSDQCSTFTKACSSTPIDGDGDGESPSSLGMCGLDCNDSNASVSSKQTMFFPTGYPTAAGAASFDYNCDGTSEQESTQVFDCELVGGVCTIVNKGWVNTVPACGATGRWAESCRKVLTSTCIPTQLDKVQACR